MDETLATEALSVAPVTLMARAPDSYLLALLTSRAPLTKAQWDYIERAEALASDDEYQTA